MTSNYSEIAFILDRSGSMESLREEAVLGFNEFLREQQESSENRRLSLILFDDEYLIPIDSVPVAEITPLTAADFEPRATTALLDAIGKTIDDMGERFANMAEADRPAGVVFAILTDGYENASRHYTWRAVADRIKHQADVYKWKFMFLGANQDAIATASNLNISQKDAALFAADPIGIRAATAALGRRTNFFCARAIPGSVEGLEECAESMEDLVKEEDRKRRGADDD